MLLLGWGNKAYGSPLVNTNLGEFVEDGSPDSPVSQAAALVQCLFCPGRGRPGAVATQGQQLIDRILRSLQQLGSAQRTTNHALEEVGVSHPVPLAARAPSPVVLAFL